MEAKFPGWYQKKLDAVTDAEKELRELELSLLSPEEKEAQTKLDSMRAEHSKLGEAITAHIAKHAALYPNNPAFSAQVKKKTSTPKEGGSTNTSDKTIRPFTGTLLDLKTATERVKSLHEAGTTSESAIIKAIYGEDFTISGDAKVNVGNGNPRSQIHSIRITLGYVATA